MAASMKRFSARNFKGDFTRAYDIPHSLLCRRSRGGPEDVLALLSVEELEKGLLPNVFPAERGSVANLIGFVGALVESVAVSCYFWAQYQSLESYYLLQVFRVRSSLPSLQSESWYFYTWSREARSNL